MIRLIMLPDINIAVQIPYRSPLITMGVLLLEATANVLNVRLSPQPSHHGPIKTPSGSLFALTPCMRLPSAQPRAPLYFPLVFPANLHCLRQAAPCPSPSPSLPLASAFPRSNRTQIRGAIARERGKGVEALPTYPAPSPTSSSKPALPSNPPPASDTTTTPEDKKPVESRVSGGASPQWSSPGSSNGSTSSEDEKPPYNSNSPLRLGKG